MPAKSSKLALTTTTAKVKAITVKTDANTSLFAMHQFKLSRTSKSLNYLFQMFFSKLP